MTKKVAKKTTPKKKVAKKTTKKVAKKWMDGLRNDNIVIYFNYTLVNLKKQKIQNRNFY